MTMICSNGPYLIPVNAKDELLIVCRHNVTDEEAKAWGADGEEKALKAHNGVTGFIEDCLKYKTEVFQCIKTAKLKSTENVYT